MYIYVCSMYVVYVCMWLYTVLGTITLEINELLLIYKESNILLLEITFIKSNLLQFKGTKNFNTLL